MSINKPLVSVCVQTYQHYAFIETCLDSIISQKTEFSFEIIVGEDQSSDGTREICQEYADKYPGLIRLFLRSRKDVIHVNGKPTGRYNFIENLKAARGKYIALCEGDDFWVDERKLQKQVRFLEQRPEYVILFNSYDKLINNQRVPGIKYEGDIDFTSFMKKNSRTLPIQTGSVVFLKNDKLIDFFSEHYRQTITGDYALFLLTLSKGLGYCLKDVMSVYRMHPGGVSNNFRSESWYQIRISVLEVLLREGILTRENATSSKSFLKNVYKNYAVKLIKEGDYLQGASILMKRFFR